MAKIFSILTVVVVGAGALYYKQSIAPAAVSAPPSHVEKVKPVVAAAKPLPPGLTTESLAKDAVALHERARQYAKHQFLGDLALSAEIRDIEVLVNRCQDKSGEYTLSDNKELFDKVEAALNKAILKMDQQVNEPSPPADKKDSGGSIDININGSIAPGGLLNGGMGG